MDFTKTIINAIKIWVNKQLSFIENKISDLEDRPSAFIQPEEPNEAPDGTLWIDTDEESSNAIEIEIDSELNETSENPVQNKVINAAINNLNNLIGDTAAIINNTKPDWNQIDETAKDYIKNRTHGEFIQCDVIIENIDCTNPVEYRNSNDEVISYQYDNIDLEALVEKRYRFTIGALYKVVINGETHILRAEKNLEDKYNIDIYLGNSSLYDESFSINTDKNFVIISHKEPTQVKPYTWLFYKEPIENISLSIYDAKEQLKQLDDKYIQDTIAHAHQEVSEDVLIDGLTQEDYNSGHYQTCTLNPDKLYKVILNGEIYDDLTCTISDERIAIFYNENDIQFEISHDNDGNFSIFAPDNWTVTVIQKNVDYKLNDSYIPNSVARKSDITWENLVDKPFEDSSKVYEWLSNVEYTERVEGPQCPLVKISNNISDKTDFIGGKLYIEGIFDGEVMSEELLIGEDMMLDIADGVFAVSDAIIVVTVDTVDIEGVTFTKGVWIADFIAMNAPYTKAQVTTIGSIKHIDEKFIPDTIARVSDIPMPQTASVGQFIVVSAVDENGKVTATEAVTLLDAEGVAF